MADSSNDYLAVYKRFFENFAKTIDPDDQLPVRVGGYRLWDSEIVGETVDWTLQYLRQRNCPSSLLGPITRMVIDEIQQQCATQPVSCGFLPEENCYLPLRLMRAVTNKVNEVCLRYCDDGRVSSLPPPTPGPHMSSSCAVKNTRRCMEDRHVILEDFHAFFGIKDASPTSYYAVFDGHAGTDAAIYSVCHLHQFLAESSHYPTDPAKALKEAFFRTDNLFIEKSKKENLRSGTTAICALMRPKEKELYIAWLGDSQAILVRDNGIIQLVNPHKPNRQDEMTRIQNMGGSVLYWGSWRVNGQLAVSRAIGDIKYKPYVTAEPDVTTIPLEGNEDYLVLACDGLWDFVSVYSVVKAVVNQLRETPGDVEAVSQRLVQLSKHEGSNDNITVIFVLLRDSAEIVSGGPVRSKFLDEIFGMSNLSDLMSGAGVDPSAATAVAASDANTNPFEADMAATIKASAPALFEVAPGSESAFVPPPYKNGHANGNLLDFLEHAANVVNATTNGKGEHEMDDDEDDDSGAEAGCGGIALDLNRGSTTQQQLQQSSNPFCDDLAEELQRQQTQEFDPEGEPARDTPTPPADEVPGVIGLVSDNVAESGEESEDEWNYYKVEPTEKSPQPATEPEKQTKEEVCQKDQLEDDEENLDDMESQLNPNAAEFIPSPTHSRPSMEELILSQGKNDTSMEDLIVPSSSEFEKEVVSRPSDVSFENSFFNSSLSSINSSGLLEKQEKEISDSQSEFTGTEKAEFVNPLSKELTNIQEVSATFDESSAFSTKAEFGDESTTSFMNMEVDFQKVAGTNEVMESSVTREESFKFPGVPINEVTSEELVSENNVEVLSEETTFQETVNDLQKEPVHISFELHKEIAPQMESQPERVKVDSVDDSPIESDVQIVNDLPIESSESNIFTGEKFPGILEQDNQKLVTQKNVESMFDDLLHENVNQELLSNKIQYIQSEKTEFSPKMETFDTDFSNPLVDVQQTEFNTVEESQTLMPINDKIESESFVDDFREKLSIQNESLNFNNEMSTPEYEKLEKVVEASEALMDQINMTRKDVPAESTISEPNFSETEPAEDVILESAHPDKTQLLVDACAEIVAPVPNDSMNLIMDSEIVQCSSDLPELLSSEKSPLSNPVQFETEPVDIMMQASEQIQETLSFLASEETSNEPIADQSSEILPTIEIPQHENHLDATQTPPPTPAVNQVVEPLNFNAEVENFNQVIEKLSVAEYALPERVTDNVRNLDADVSESCVDVMETGVAPVHEPTVDVGVLESEVPSAEINISHMTEEERIQDIDQSSIVSAEIAGAGVAATAVVAAGVVAAAASTNEDLKKELESATKKIPSSSATRKSTAEKAKGVAEKPKAASADKPKTAAKTTATSKLTSVAKTKSPTSPVKSPVAVKAAAPRPPVATTKPIPKVPPPTRTSTSAAAKPLSSTIGTTSAASRTKTAISQPLTKPAVPRTSTLKRPSTAPSNIEKKPLTNGDIKTAPKRPEQLPTKTASRPPSRPATAPAARTITKTVSKDSSNVTKTTSLNGPSRPRPLSSVSSRTTSKPSTDKETKESANKQISTRTTTSTSTIRSTLSSSAKSSAQSAPRKIESKPLTNGRSPTLKQTSTVKSTTSSKVPPKRPATATRLKSTKTTVLVEKSETVQGSKTVVTTNEVKSEVVLDNSQSAA